MIVTGVTQQLSEDRYSIHEDKHTSLDGALLFTVLTLTCSPAHTDAAGRVMQVLVDLSLYLLLFLDPAHAHTQLAWQNHM